MVFLGKRKNNKYFYKFTAIVACFLGMLLIIFNTQASTLLSDDFTGTTINTLKWNELDAGGAGGTSGSIQQNGSLTVAGSFAGSVWGTTALYSTDTFDSSGFEVSAVMTPAGNAQLLGYGDYNFQAAGTKAFMIDLAGSSIYAIAWDNAGVSAIDTGCGTVTSGATYKLKIISGGFEVYKNGSLQCTLNTSTVVNNKPVFFESADNSLASTFDDLLVTGTSVAPTVPGAPTGLGAIAGNTQASLSWTAPVSNGGSAITDYLVEYKLNSEPTTWTTFSDGTSTSTTTTVTGLTNALLYNFRVSAINAIGTSTPSSTANATPVAPTVPGAPTGLGAIAGNTQASLSWTAPVSNGGSAITDYLVEYKLNSEPTTWTTFSDGTSTSTTTTVTGLTNALLYNFRVSAINAIGTGISSSTANATPGIEVPLTISNMSLWLDGSDTATITESSGIISQVNDKSGNNKNGTASGSVRPTLVSSVQNGRSVIRFDGGDDYLNINSSVTYRTVFVVAKYDNTSFSTYAGIIGDFTGTSPSNGHVLNGVDATTKLATATSSYTAAYRNGTSISGSSGHNFAPLNEFWIGAFELPSSMTNTTSSIGMINGGGRYWDGDIAEVIAYSTTLDNTQRATIEAYLSAKWGIAVSGPTAPSAPSGLVADSGNAQINLSWTAPASGGSAITDYIIEYKLTSEPTTWITFSDGVSTTASATVTGLSNGSSYDFRVKAVNAIGTSSPSSTVTATPSLPTTPGAPTSLSASTANAQSVLTWIAPVLTGGSPITDYLVQYKLNSEPTIWTTFVDGVSTLLTTTVTGLTNGLAYNFIVSAINAIGTGTPSSSANATPALIGTVLTDDFTGTTIDTSKWLEIDSVAGGLGGSITQNGTLSVADGYINSSWGATALISQETFVNTGLEISAVMTPGSGQMIAYGDYLFGDAANKAYLLYLTAPGGDILPLVWSGGNYTSVSCGSGNATTGATYKMKIISGGFEVYKNGVLQCTFTTAVAINNKPIFLESASTASTYDDILVYGTASTHTIPDAPTIGTATGDNASAIITFSPPSNNGGAAITNYTVTSSPGGFTGTGPTSPITVTGLTNGTAYTFTVTATNSVGTSSASSTSNSVTPALPTVPDQVTGVSATGVNKQVLLDWDTPGSGGAAISDYLVEYKTSAGSSWYTFSHSISTATKIIVTSLVNDITYDFRISAINSGGAGTASAIVSATPSAISNLAFVITGESNSGGIGPNSDATPTELAPRSAVQIMNLTSGTFLFEDLDIGTNNLRDHDGLGGYYDTSHGFELQLANSTVAHSFPDNEQVYLVKTGQGGSQVAQWNVGGTYWNKFLQRTAAAKTQIAVPRQWVVWMSLGINDAISGTNVNTWKTAMIDHINKIKADLPGAIIIMTEFQSMPAGNGYPTYNTAIQQIAASEANVYSVDTTGAGTDGANHWLYLGLKQVTNSMVTVTKNTLGLNFPGLPTGLGATPSGNQVALSWTAPISNGGSSLTDYLIEYKTSVSNTWSTFADGVSTGTTAIVTGLSSETIYNFRVSAVNSTGSGNSISVSATTPDSAAPILSSVTSTPSDTSSSITWTTDELASSIVDYGLTNSYGTSTSETDTSPRVLSHTVSIPSLVACTTYHYRVHSKDALLNTATGSDNTFTTTGCVGSATVTAQTQASITTASGGSASLTSGPTGLGLTIPPGATGADAVYQIKQLDKTTAFVASGTPPSVASVGDYAFDLKSLTGTGTSVTTFLAPITLTLTYQDSDVVGIDESSLVIYRYNGSVWSALTGCIINTSANTITCDTSNFSLFSLFGTVQAASSGGGGTTLSSYSPPEVPQGGFKILINNNTTTTSSRNVTLSFNAQSDVVRMALSNSTDFSHSSIEPYAKTKAWDLCSLNGASSTEACFDGTKTVYAKFYTAYGQPSAVLSATIELNQQPNQTPSTTEVATKLKVFIKDLKLGDINTLVKRLQQFLNTHGFLVAKTGSGSKGKETTTFGKLSKIALTKFQISKKITPSNGILNLPTRLVIEQTVATPTVQSNNPTPLSLVNPVSLFTRDLKFGMVGDDVRSLQKLLIAKNSGPAAKALAVNKPSGRFGDLTKSALIEFQKSNNIQPANGFFEVKTRAYINKLINQK